MPRPRARAPTLPPLALYVHLPWCLSKCPYCDFNSHALPGAAPNGLERALQRDYVNALIADLEGDLAYVQGRRLVSIFLGGGTPNLFDAASIAKLLDAICARTAPAPACEITLEANPGVEAADFAGFRAAGVNRLSLGVQSFDDATLARLGRAHSGADAIRAFEAARRAGFDNVNLDLMFGLPRQTIALGLADLRRCLALAPDHVSYYQLTIEPNTVFYASPPPLPDDETVWRLQQEAAATLREHGYRRYEVSAYAATKRCRHNLNYWRFGDYIGIGAGAHGKVTMASSAAVVRTRKHRRPQRYVEQAQAGGHRRAEERTLADDDLLFEFLLNALRLADGFEASLFPRRTGLDGRLLRRRLRPLMGRGLIEHRGGRYAATPRGARFLNDVLEELLPEAGGGRSQSVPSSPAPFAATKATYAHATPIALMRADSA